MGDLVSNNNDELYNKAIDIVIKQQKVSTSFVKRYLQIGYNVLQGCRKNGRRQYYN